MSVHYHSTPQCSPFSPHDSCPSEEHVNCTRIQTEPEELFLCEHVDPAQNPAADTSPNQGEDPRA